MKKIEIKGVFSGDNLYMSNPFGSGGIGFCVKNLKINGEKKINTEESLVELDFKSMNLKIGDPILIEMNHVDGCMPRFVNGEVITNDKTILKKTSYLTEAILVHATILDETTKEPILNTVIKTINLKDTNDMFDGSRGFKNGTYNILVRWGTVYELTIGSLDDSSGIVPNFKSKFNYSIKKIILDLTNIPKEDKLLFKKQISVEFLLPKKKDKSIDDLFSKFAIAKLNYNPILKKLMWDLDYERAIKEAAKILNTQLETKNKLSIERINALEKEKEVKQQRLIRNLFIAGFMILLSLGAIIYRSLRLNKKAKLIIEAQKHLVEEKHKEITDSINYAERIQRSFLATKQLLASNLNEHFVFFRPKDVVSGDFYWASKLSNGSFALVTADSTGHGVPGAIMSILNISCLENAVKEGVLEPKEILNHTRINIIERLKKDGTAEGGKDGMDCSLICFDFKNGKLIYSAANNPVWIVRDNTILEFAPDKMPVGKHDRDSISFTQHEVALNKGDVVYAITDGMPDQFGGPKGKKFMYKKLKEFFIGISGLSMNEQREKIKFEFESWKGNIEQVDDVTVIGVRV